MNSKLLFTTLLCLSCLGINAQEPPTSQGKALSNLSVVKDAQTIVVKRLNNSSQASFRIVAEAKSPSTKSPDFIHFDNSTGTYHSKAEFTQISDEAVKKELKKHLEAFSKLEDAENLIVVVVGNFKEDDIKALVSSTVRSNSLNKPVKVDSKANPYDICYVSISVVSDRIPTVKDLWVSRAIEEYLIDQIKETSPSTFSFSSSEPSATSIKIKPVETLSSKVKEEMDSLIRQISLKGISSAELEALKDTFLEKIEAVRSFAAAQPSAALANYLAELTSSRRGTVSFEEYLEHSSEVIKNVSLEELNDALKSCKFFYTFRAASDSRDSATSTMPLTEPESNPPKSIEVDNIPSIDSPFDDDLNGSDEVQTQATSSEPSVALYFADPQSEVEAYQTLPINDYESKVIRNIIHTMAEHNPVKLLFKEGELNKMGDQINHVHPLKFLSAIFENPGSRKDMKKVMDNSFKFNGFMEGGKRGGLSRRMNDEFAKNNLMQHVPGFCSHLHVDPNAVTHYIQKKDWKGLVVFLSKHAH